MAATSRLTPDEFIDMLTGATPAQLARIEAALNAAGYSKRGSRSYSDDIEDILDSDVTHSEKKLALETKIAEVEAEILDLKTRLAAATSEEEKAELRAEIRQQKRLKAEYEEARNGETRLGQLKKAGNALNNITSTIQHIYSDITRMNDPWAKADAAASKYGKTIGQVSAGINALRKNTLNNVLNQKLGINYNISTDELIGLQENYSKAVGRNVRLSNADQENLAAVNMATDGMGNELLPEFEKLGVFLSEASDHIGGMFADASKEGVSLERYAKNVQQGLAMAQTYTFKDGIRGMEEMARRAAAIRMDMSQIQSFANSFNTVEKAIQNSAKLQVLGGPFAAGANPLGLLHDSLMGVEDVQKRMEEFTAGMARYDKETGEVKVNQFNKMRLQAYAEATGQDYAKVMETVNRQGVVREIESQISGSVNAANLNDDMKALIKNAGEIKGGKAGVTIDGNFKTIDELTNADQEDLIKETQDQSRDVKDIAKSVRSLLDIRSGARKQKDAVQAKLTSPFAQLEKKLTNLIGHSNFLLGAILAVQAVNSVSRWFSGGGRMPKMKGGVKGAWRNVKDFFKPASSTGSMTGSASKIVGKAMPKGGKQIISNAGKTYTKVGNRVFNSTGKELFGASKNSVLKTATKATAKKTAAKTATKTAAKTAAKVGAKGATKIAGKLAMGAAKGAGIGIIGAAGNIATDYLVDSGKIKKGGTAHAAMKVGSTALEGAAMASMIAPFFGPGAPIVTALGAAAGAIVGAAKIQKVRREQVVDNQLQAMGIERKGNYSSSKLKDIDTALQTGKMSNRLRKKLLREGDTDILNQIKAVDAQKKAEKEEAKAKKRQEREERKDKRAERMSKLLGGVSANKFGTAKFEIGTAYINGGSIRSGRGREKSIADTLKTAGKMKKGVSIAGGAALGSAFGPVGTVLGGVLGGILGKSKGESPVSILRGKKEDGSSKELTIFKKLNAKAGTNTAKNENTSSNKPVEVKIDGKIELKTPNGQNFDLMAEIKKDPQLLRRLTQEIIKEMNIQTHGGYRSDRAFGNNIPNSNS